MEADVDMEEIEEEEFMVHVEFDGLLDSNILTRPNVLFKVIGLETERPVMQLEEQVFVGEYRDILGTALFFEENQTPISGDPVFGRNFDTHLEYRYKTRKALLMSRVFLKPKHGDKSDGSTMETGNSSVSDGSDSASTQFVIPSEDGTESVEQADISFQSDSQGNNDSLAMVVESACDKEQGESESSNSLTQDDGSSRSRTDSNLIQDANSHVKADLEEIEPIPGPSWAPDIPEFQFKVKQKPLSELPVDASDTPRLTS